MNVSVNDYQSSVIALQGQWCKSTEKTKILPLPPKSL